MCALACVCFVVVAVVAVAMSSTLQTLQVDLNDLRASSSAEIDRLEGLVATREADVVKLETEYVVVLFLSFHVVVVIFCFN